MAGLATIGEVLATPRPRDLHRAARELQQLVLRKMVEHAVAISAPDAIELAHDIAGNVAQAIEEWGR